MLNKKLIHYFKTFDKEEWKSFGRYLMYSSSKEPKNAILLYNYLDKIYPDFQENDTKLYVEKIAHKLFKHNKQAVHDTAEFLLKKAQKWLAIQHISDADESFYDVFLCHALEKRATMHQEFMNHTEKTIQQLMDSEMKDHETLFHTFFLTYKQYAHPQTIRGSIENKLLQETLVHLEQFYLINKLRFGIELLCLRSNLLKEENHIEHWDLLLEIARKSTNPLVERYVFIYDIQHNQKPFDIQKLEHYLLHSGIILSTADYDLFISFLNTIYNKQIKSGRIELYLPLYQLYLFGIEKGIYIQNNQISFNTFRNIVIVMSRAKLEKELNEFLEKYSPMLSAEIRDTAQYLAWAYYYHYLKDYDLVLENINNLSKSNVIIKINAYVLEIIAIFELSFNDKNLYNLLDAKLNNFRAYLDNNTEWNEDKLKGYKNFRSLSNYLHSIRYDSKIEKDSLLQKLNQKGTIVMREWLIEMIDKLGK